MGMKSVGLALIFTCLVASCGSADPQIPTWKTLAERYQPQIAVTSSASPSKAGDMVVCQETIDQDECFQQMANMRFELSEDIDRMPDRPEKNGITPQLEEFQRVWKKYADGCILNGMSPIICEILANDIDKLLVSIWVALDVNKN